MTTDPTPPPKKLKTYARGTGCTGRFNPRDPHYSQDGAAINMPKWARNIIMRHALAQRKTNCQFVAEWAERLEKEEKLIGVCSDGSNGNTTNTKGHTTP